MAAVRAKDTKPELLIRKGLHARGLRYRLHVRGLPGRPDLVFPKSGAVLFVHGCFWHGHVCELFTLPVSRREFWTEKISKNRRRDENVLEALREVGWRTGVIRECALRGKRRREPEQIFALTESWIRNGGEDFELTGR